MNWVAKKFLEFRERPRKQGLEIPFPVLPLKLIKVVFSFNEIDRCQTSQRNINKDIYIYTHGDRQNGRAGPMYFGSLR
jgi:hypothetical protein